MYLNLYDHQIHVEDAIDQRLNDIHEPKDNQNKRTIWIQFYTFCKYLFSSSLEWKRSGRGGGAKKKYYSIKQKKKEERTYVVH